MLAYSGRGSVEVESVDLNALVGEMSALLQSAVWQNVSLLKDFAGAPLAVQADATEPAPATVESLPDSSSVLVVDDESLGPMIVVGILDDIGVQVISTHNGARAVELVKAHAHDIELVLMDVNIPERGGHAAVTAIRKVIPAVPVLMMIGYDEPEVNTGGNAETAPGFIQKLFETHVPKGCVKAAIEQRLALTRRCARPPQR